MNIKAMLHAEILYKGKFYTRPKRQWSLKIPVVPCRTSAPFLQGSESFKRKIRWLSAKKRKRGLGRSPHAIVQPVGFLMNLQ